MTFPSIAKPTTRRRFSPKFKQKIIDLCKPGVPVAVVARAHGINPELLRKWIREQRALAPSVASGIKLVPLAVSPSRALQDQVIEIEVDRNGTRVLLRWPSSALSSLASFLKDWLV